MDVRTVATNELSVINLKTRVGWNTDGHVEVSDEARDT